MHGYSHWTVINVAFYDDMLLVGPWYLGLYGPLIIKCYIIYIS